MLEDTINTSGSGSYWVDDYGKVVVHPTLGEFHVSPTQLKILKLLHSEPGRVFSQREILERVWGENTTLHEDNVRMQIKDLRAKVKKDIVDTIKPRGYAVGFGSHTEYENVTNQASVRPEKQMGCQVDGPVFEQPQQILCSCPNQRQRVRMLLPCLDLSAAGVQAYQGCTGKRARTGRKRSGRRKRSTNLNPGI